MSRLSPFPSRNPNAASLGPLSPLPADQGGGYPRGGVSRDCSSWGILGLKVDWITQGSAPGASPALPEPPQHSELSRSSHEIKSSTDLVFRVTGRCSRILRAPGQVVRSKARL